MIRAFLRPFRLRRAQARLIDALGRLNDARARGHTQDIGRATRALRDARNAILAVGP